MTILERDDNHIPIQASGAAGAVEMAYDLILVDD